MASGIASDFYEQPSGQINPEISRRDFLKYLSVLSAAAFTGSLFSSDAYARQPISTVDSTQLIACDTNNEVGKISQGDVLEVRMNEHIPVDYFVGLEPHSSKDGIYHVIMGLNTKKYESRDFRYVRFFLLKEIDKSRYELLDSESFRSLLYQIRLPEISWNYSKSGKLIDVTVALNRYHNPEGGGPKKQTKTLEAGKQQGNVINKGKTKEMRIK